MFRFLVSETRQCKCSLSYRGLRSLSFSSHFPERNQNITFAIGVVHEKSSPCTTVDFRTKFPVQKKSDFIEFINMKILENYDLRNSELCELRQWDNHE